MCRKISHGLKRSCVYSIRTWICTRMWLTTILAYVVVLELTSEGHRSIRVALPHDFRIGELACSFDSNLKSHAGADWSRLGKVRTPRYVTTVCCRTQSILPDVNLSMTSQTRYTGLPWNASLPLYIRHQSLPIRTYVVSQPILCSYVIYNIYSLCQWIFVIDTKHLSGR